MRCLAVILVMALTVPGICFGGQPTLDKAWTYYLKGDYKRTVNACRIASKNRMLGEEGRYLMGLSQLKLNDAAEARKNFEFVLENYPRSSTKAELLLGIADSYFIEERFDIAEQEYRRLLGSFSNTGYASIAYLRLAISQQRQGKWQEADASLHKLIRDYPLSLEVDEARTYLKRKGDFFSVQVGAFSKKENAGKLLSTLRKKGYDVRVEKSYKNDKLIYLVKIGKFGTKAKAQQEAKRLKKEGFSARISS